jgi:hypothetical protein
MLNGNLENFEIFEWSGNSKASVLLEALSGTLAPRRGSYY